MIESEKAIIIKFLKKACALVPENRREWMTVNNDMAYITDSHILLKHYVGDIFEKSQPIRAMKSDIKSFLKGQPFNASIVHHLTITVLENVTEVPKGYVSAPFEESLISFDKADAGKRPVMNLQKVNKAMALFNFTVTVSHAPEDFQNKPVVFKGKSKFGHDLTVVLMPERMY